MPLLVIEGVVSLGEMRMTLLMSGHIKFFDVADRPARDLELFLACPFQISSNFC